MQTLSPISLPLPTMSGPSAVGALVSHVVRTARDRRTERAWRAAYAIHTRLVAQYRAALDADDMAQLARVGRALDVAWDRCLVIALGMPLAAALA